MEDDQQVKRSFQNLIAGIRFLFLIAAITILILKPERPAETPEHISSWRFIALSQANQVNGSSGNPLRTGTDAETGAPCVSGYYLYLPVGARHAQQVYFTAPMDPTGMVRNEMKKQGYTVISDSDINPHDRLGRWIILIGFYSIIALLLFLMRKNASVPAQSSLPG